MEYIRKKDNRTPGYVANIIIHIILLYIIFNIRYWVGFLTDGVEAIIWMLAISYGATIILNFIYIFYDGLWFRSLTQVALNVYNIVIFYTMLKIFPFDLDTNYQIVARVIIYVVICGTAIGAIVEFSRFIRLIANGGDEIHAE